MIRWFHVEPQGVDPCAYVPGLYTQAQVDDLINIDGYIPVADADEFDKIRTGAVETMGGCSIWAGSYTTGPDKKYIQVKPLDLVAYTIWLGIDAFDGIYDGNELQITNHIGEYLFQNTINTNPCQIKNIIDISCNISIVFNSCGAIIRNLVSGSIIDNCHVTGTVLSTSESGQVGGICGISVTGSLISQISNCSFEGSVTGVSKVGGIVGEIQKTNLTNCFVNNSTIANSNAALISEIGDSGGMVGISQIASCTISACAVINSIINFRAIRSGGFIGSNLIQTTISDSYVLSCAMTFQGSRLVGGFIGSHQGAGSVISKCYATGSSTQTGTVSENGGFAGLSLATIRECYADVNVTSPSASGSHFGTGGFVGDNRAGSLIENCYAYGTVLGRNEVGGFAGRGDGTIRYSYSTGSATGTTNVGGFIGRVTTTNSQTAAYWDTDTSGNATSAGAGTSGQTTVALQTPTSNTGIYSAWDALVWDFGTSVEYPSLINTP